ncbi:hypothetical protein [Streptomyces sp. NPDC002133]|uniref:hypothetical protein n=1 Tax=Streptomyces sp. NPDC002133 TaxID=3154409 RepID=UPI003332DADD
MSAVSDEDALRVREAMERTTADLPALPDLAPAAVAQGQRRRVRARLAAVAASVAGVAVLGTLGMVALPGSDGDGGGVVVPAAPPTSPVPYRTPVHVEPTPGEESMAELPDAERKRLEDFQQRAAASLNRTLGGAAGEIRPVDLSVRLYQAEKDGRKFPVIFSVQPQDGRQQKPCPDAPVKGISCSVAELPGGIPATVMLMPTNEGISSTNVTFSYGQSKVWLAVSPDDAAGVSAPVNGEQLLAAARDEALLELVRYADEHPVLKKQQSVRGG